jgi:hypothetical protein
MLVAPDRSIPHECHLAIPFDMQLPDMAYVREEQRRRTTPTTLGVDSLTSDDVVSLSLWVIDSIVVVFIAVLVMQEYR